MIDEMADQIIDLLGCDREDIIEASGKTGIGVPEIMAAVVVVLVEALEREVFKLAGTLMPQVVEELLAENGHAADDLSLVLMLPWLSFL